MLEIAELQTALIGPISLRVAPGACAALMGASGSGKSLFLRAIADLDPNEGAVRLDGTDRQSVSAPEWRRRVGLVPAESGWWADRVADHFGSGDPAPLLTALGLPAEAMSWEVARLSTGERQRLAMARALLAGPEALLLDEPTASLDAAATARLEALLQEKRRAGLAVLLVTHDPAQARRMAAQRYVMEAGRLSPAIDGPPPETARP